MIDADNLLADGKPACVRATLEKASLPRYLDHHQVDLMRARAEDAAGNTQVAYTALLKVFAATPSDELRRTLAGYGEKLGKDSKQVESEVTAQIGANSRPAPPFSLINYSTKKPMSVADFKGRVFLLNFWYPQCGPCRGEFPYIQAVLDKYKSQGFEIAAVNVHPPEDDFVLPLLKGFRLGFHPTEER